MRRALHVSGAAGFQFRPESSLIWSCLLNLGCLAYFGYRIKSSITDPTGNDDKYLYKSFSYRLHYVRLLRQVCGPNTFRIVPVFS